MANLKVLVVADVSNLFYCAKKKFNKHLDYQKFLELAVRDRQIWRAIAYGAELNGQAASFKNALKYVGFETKYKTPKTYPTADPGKEYRKADWDVGIAMDVVQMLDSVDVVVIGSADSDMAPLVEYIKSRGKIAEVIASGISRELKDAANYWYEIDNNMLQDPKKVPV